MNVARELRSPGARPKRYCDAAPSIRCEYPMTTSPCVNVCTVEDGACSACGRTLEQIAAWSTMSEAERRAIVAELES